MKKVATVFLAISLLATTPVFAAEQESDPIQQEEGMIEQGENQELTVDEIMAQKGMKSALESFYDKFPQAKTYEISGTIIKNEGTSRLKLFIISETESFILDFDQERITNYTQINRIPDVELEGPMIQGILNKIYSLLPEAKDLKRDSSFTQIDNGGKKIYILSFSEDKGLEQSEISSKGLMIHFDETGKIITFDFDSMPLINLKGETKEEKAYELLKQFYGDEAKEYKIKRVNEISENDPNYKDHKDFMRGAIVFTHTSSKEKPILVGFNSEDELTMLQVTTQDFLKE